jgi:drug/metabolite transporter (DMT)-like permease
MAAALILVAMAVVPCMDGIAKYLSRDYPVVQIVWARYFFHFLLLCPVLLLRFPLASLRPKRAGLQVLRGGLLLVSTVLFFAAISVIPLADAIALVFISPLVVTALSPFLLGEKVGFHRYGAVVLGLIGALIVIRPGQGAFEAAALLAAGAGVVYAFYSILTRKLSGSAPALVTLGYTALLGAVFVSLVVPFHWVSPDLNGWLMMAAMGVVAAVGHYFVIKAFELAPASFLAPFGYSEIVMTTIIGYTVFGDFPDYLTWIGIFVIIASGVYITWREKVRARKVTTRTIPGPDF